MNQKLPIAAIGIVVCIIMLAGCCQKQDVEKNLRTIKDVSIPARLYWLEGAKETESNPGAETVYLTEYDLERHTIARTNFRVGDGAQLEMIETNHPGSVIVAEKIDEGSFRIYAFDENGRFDCRYSGTVPKYNSAHALYDGILYYCDGYQSYKRSLSTDTEQQLPDEIRFGGMCISSEGKFFDCFAGEREDSIRIRIVSGKEITNHDYDFPEDTKPYCRSAVWKNSDSVLLAIELQLGKEKEVRLFEFSLQDCSLKPCLTEQGEKIILESAKIGWLAADSLQIDKSERYISYVNIEPNYYNGIWDMDIYVQSLTDGMKYAVYSIRDENAWLHAGIYAKAIWGN